MIAAASVVMMTGQVALTTTDGEEWLLSDEEMVERYDALDAARLQLPGALAEDSAELPRTEIHLEATTIFMYVDEETGNMLTPRGLHVIKQVYPRSSSRVRSPDGSKSNELCCRTGADIPCSIRGIF